jgi:hypothetical protein
MKEKQFYKLCGIIRQNIETNNLEQFKKIIPLPLCKEQHVHVIWLIFYNSNLRLFKYYFENGIQDCLIFDIVQHFLSRILTDPNVQPFYNFLKNQERKYKINNLK